MIARALNALGLRSAPVEPVVPVVHVDWEAKFKKAATNLAKQAEEIARQDDKIESMAWEIKRHEDEIRERKQVQYDLARARLEIEALRPDAQKWRNARDKRAKNRGGGK